MKNLTLAQLLIGAGGAIAFLFSFLDFGFGISAWNTNVFAYVSTIPAILGLAAAIWVGCELAGIKLPDEVLTFNPAQLKVTWGVSAAGVMLAFFTANDGKGVGFWLMLIGTLAMAVGAVMSLLGNWNDPLNATSNMSETAVTADAVGAVSEAAPQQTAGAAASPSGVPTELPQPSAAPQAPPQQIAGAVGSPNPSGVPTDSSTPVFDDPQDATRWRMVHLVHSAVVEMMNKNTQCFEKAEKVEKAYGIANAEFVNGVRQQKSSMATFRRFAEESERELKSLLLELRTATISAQNQWKDLVFLLPGSDSDVMKISNWCQSHGVDSNVMSSVIANGAFIHTDFGTTRESFWAENQRVTAIFEGGGQ